MIFNEYSYKNLHDIPKPFRGFPVHSQKSTLPKVEPMDMLDASDPSEQEVAEGQENVSSTSTSSKSVVNPHLPQGDLLFLLLLFFLLSDHDMDWLRKTIGI